MDTDPQDSLSYYFTDAPSDMIIDALTGVISWTPSENQIGENNVTVVVSDLLGATDSQSFTVTVEPTNKAPVILDETISVNEDSVFSGLLSATDIDGDSLTYTVISLPTNGQISLQGADYSYTPNQNYNGSDAFTVEVSDGVLSNTAIVSITINPVNDQPSVVVSPVVTSEDSLVNGQIQATDIDGDSLTYSLVTQASNGQAVLNGTAFTYLPSANFNGADSFTIRISDGVVFVDAVYSVSVLAVNDAPVLTVLPVVVNEDSTVSASINATDSDGDSLSYTLANSTSNGLVTINGSSFTYTPVANFNGSDSFTIQVSDGLSTVSGQYSVIVNSINDAPIVNVSLVTTSEDTAVNGLIEASDVDGDTLSYVVRLKHKVARLPLTSNTFTYTPNDNFNGVDSFSVQVSDGIASVNASYSVSVTSVNDLPVVTVEPLIVIEDTTLNYVIDATDADEDALTFAVSQNATNGVVELEESNLTYTPNANFSGSDSFSIIVSDSTEQVSAQYSINVTNVNDAPIATPIILELIENSSANALLTGTDIEGANLTYRVMSSPTNGTLTGVSPNLVYYTPNENFSGIDSFQFVANDGDLDSQESVVSILVFPTENNAPSINSKPVIFGSEQSLYFYQVEASDPDEHSLSYSVTGAPAGLTINPETGLVDWSVPVAGEYTVVISAADIFGASTEQRYSLFITPPQPAITSEGTDFWFMYNANVSSSYLLYVASQHTTDISVTFPGLGLTENYKVEGGQVMTIDMSAIQQTPYGQVRGAHLSSVLPVTAYLINQARDSTDASVIYPTHTLGTDYSVATYRQAENSNGSLYGIVATEDNTVVTITPKTAYNPSRPAGVPFQRTLNQGQTFGESAYPGVDVSGTRIQSDKAIAVFAGNLCTAIVTESACDHLVEQLQPTASLGASYLTVPLAMRLKGDTVRVYAVEDDTIIRINDKIVMQLEAGENYTTILDQASIITASHPIQVMQFANSYSYDEVIGDPFMLAVPPVEQFLSAYIVTTPAEGFERNFINLTAHQSVSDTILVDGNVVDSSLWQPIADTDYVGAQIEVSMGVHTATASEPFGLYIYGFNRYDSYGYLGGVSFSPKDAVNALDVTASSLTPASGSEVCLTATVSDNQQNPVTQAQVRLMSVIQY